MEFSRQEYWSGVPCPSPEDRPEPGIEPGSPALQTDALPSELLGKPKSILLELILEEAEKLFKYDSKHLLKLKILKVLFLIFLL